MANPEGGAHSDREAAAQLLEPVLVRAPDDLSVKSVPELLERRYRKFRRMGQLAAAVRLNTLRPLRLNRINRECVQSRGMRIEG